MAPGLANDPWQYAKAQKAIEGKLPRDHKEREEYLISGNVEQLRPHLDRYGQLPDPMIVDQFKAYISQDLSARTVERYASTLREFMQFLGGSVKLDETKRTDIIAFTAYLSSPQRLRYDKAGKATPAPLSPSAVKNSVAALRRFYAYLLYTDENRNYDPTTGIRSPKIHIVRGDVLTTDEVATLLQAPGSARDRVQCWLLTFTACRSNEIRNLRWRDVNFEHGVLWVNGKGNKQRPVEIHDQLAPELFRWREHQKREALDNPALARALSNEDSAYVLISSNGQQIGSGALWKSINRRAARAGVRLKEPEYDKRGRKKDNMSEVTCHMLRRTFATSLLRSGVALDAVADVLGHESLDTTRRHYAFTDNQRRRATVNSYKIA